MKIDHNFLIHYRRGLKDSITAQKDFTDLKQYGKVVASGNFEDAEYLEKKVKISTVNKSTDFEWIFRRQGFTVSLSVKINDKGETACYWLEFMELDTFTIYEFSESALMEMENRQNKN